MLEFYKAGRHKSKLFTAIEKMNRTMMMTMLELNVLILEGTSGGSSSS